MMNHKPETTLQEDLKVLGLLSGDVKMALSEDASDSCSGDEDKGDDDADKKDGDDEDKPAKKKDKPGMQDNPEMPSFMKKKEAPEMAYAEQLEAAWDVVKGFYEELNEDSEVTFKNETLLTVIDAFRFIVESWDSQNGEPVKKCDDLAERGTSRVDLFPPKENPITMNATDNSPTAPKPVGGKYGRAMTGTQPASPRHTSTQTQSEAVNDLVSDLHDIRNAIQESGPSSEQLEVSESLISGFEAVRDSAGEVANRIGSELQESNVTDEADDRVKAAQYFEGIYNDASEILANIAEGSVDIADAVEDLNSLGQDLKNGLATLKEIG